jgi:hypothetical protein
MRKPEWLKREKIERIILGYWEEKIIFYQKVWNEG